MGIARLWRATYRFLLILLNIFYSIPTYIFWVYLLRPFGVIFPNWYRSFESILFSWLLHMVMFWTWNTGLTVAEVGDDIGEVLNDECLFLVNHQCTGDVVYLMQLLCASGRCCAGRHVCWILDNMFKYTPFGLASRVHGDFFILQGKNTRDAELGRLESYLRDLYVKRDRLWIIMFPEGGFLRNRKATSQEYGRKHGYPHLEYCTLPRVLATQSIMHVLASGDESLIPDTCHRSPPQGNTGLPSSKSLKYIVDVTIGYPDQDCVSLMEIIQGLHKPCQTVFHYRIYPVSAVPRDGEELKLWMYERYAEKDRLLEHFYRTGEFPAGESNTAEVSNGTVGSSAARRRVIPVDGNWCRIILAIFIFVTVLDLFVLYKILVFVPTVFAFVISFLF